MTASLSKDTRNHYRRALVAARGAAVADAEGAEVVIFAIENLGRHVLGKDAALEALGGPLRELVTAEGGESRRRQFEKRFELLRRGRNDRMHKGFAARNLTVDAVRVAIMLEEALNVNWNRYDAEDFMTANPLTASTWQTFGMVRDALIENAYSHLPILHEGGWKVISERTVADVAMQARRAKVDLRACRLDSIFSPSNRTLLNELASEVPVVPPDHPALSLDLTGGCVLVVRESDLVGIVTPSDVA